MEKLIRANGGKLMVVAGIFILWCFYSVVRQGGSEIPRINTLEKKAKIHEQWAQDQNLWSYKLEKRIDLLMDIERQRIIHEISKDPFIIKECKIGFIKCTVGIDRTGGR